jgi:hypothetical protein
MSITVQNWNGFSQTAARTPIQIWSIEETAQGQIH